ncbi:MAG: type III-A CRISPR-associated RAMP protein Csm4 [Bryobacteraceae bacterium]
MNPAFLIQLYPAGPWRYGPGEGGRDRVDNLYRSDRLFSAVTIAFERLGLLGDWLKATAEATTPAVVFSSLFPFQGETLFVPPPATLWPPPAAALRASSSVLSAKVRWRAARFVPVSLIETLLLSQRLLADQWTPDAESACLLRRDRPQSSPFRVTTRTVAAVDRMKHGHDTHSLACVEFEAGSGLWALASFDASSSEVWKDRLRSALRLLADSGFGARRSSGWGQVSRIGISEGEWPALVFSKLARKKQDDRSVGNGNTSTEHWLLSLFAPGETDEIDWARGNYSVTARGGYVENGTSSGKSKKMVRMVEEGSVLKSANSIRGRTVDVAPEGLDHPVYRAGFALSLALPPIDYSAAEEEIVPGSELQQALDEALRTAAEQSAPLPPPDTPEGSAKESSESESKMSGTESTQAESDYEI